MSLHGLLSVTIGVPNVEETAAYYTDFGLAPAPGSWFSTVDGGPQLRIVPAPTRRLVELHVAADDMDDLGRAATNLAAMGLGGQLSGATPCHDRAGDRHPGVPRRRPPRAPGSADGDRLQRTWALRPDGQPGPRIHATRSRPATQIGPRRARQRRLPGHHGLFRGRPRVQGQRPDQGHGRVHALFDRPPQHAGAVGAGELPAPHRRGRSTTSTMSAAARTPCSRGARSGTSGVSGRHFAGSNFFWYLKDPAGNFCEYYSDMDCIVDDQLWAPEDLEGARGLFAWGPPPPPSFLEPEDLAALMTGSHAAT